MKRSSADDGSPVAKKGRGAVSSEALPRGAGPEERSSSTTSVELPQVKVGGRVYRVGAGRCSSLRDSTALRGDAAGLRQQLAEDGYLFLRGVLPREVVHKAHSRVLHHLDGLGLVDTAAAPLEAAIVANVHDSDQGRVKDVEQLTRQPELLNLCEHPALFDLTSAVLGEPSTTLDFKWLRAMTPGESSGFHMDNVYMGRGSPQQLTCWLPFQEVSFELGGLAVLGGSHKLSGYKRIRETYAELDMDTDDVGGTLWFTEDPEEAMSYGCDLATAHFQPGDVVLFKMTTMHGSSVNQTNRWRISADVRFQPKSSPRDARWVLDETGSYPGLSSRWAKHRGRPCGFIRGRGSRPRASGA